MDNNLDRKNKLPKNSDMVNEGIYFKRVILIDDEGVNHGEISKHVALEMAKSKGLDLMVVNATANPVICKIVDYGKYKYSLKKKMQESKKKQVSAEVKSIKVRPQIQAHDLQWRANQAIEWLKQGDKIKFRIMVMGRQAAMEEDYKMNPLKVFLELIKDHGVLDGEVKLVNKDYEVMIKPNK